MRRSRVIMGAAVIVGVVVIVRLVVIVGVVVTMLMSRLMGVIVSG